MSHLVQLGDTDLLVSYSAYLVSHFQLHLVRSICDISTTPLLATNEREGDVPTLWMLVWDLSLMS